MEEGEGRPRGKSSSVVLSPKCLGVGVVTVISQSERSPAREDGAGHSCRAAGPRPARGSDNDREETGLGLRGGTFKGTGRRSPFPPEGLYSSSERGSRRRTRCSCVYETPARLTARRSYVSEACVILSAAARSRPRARVCRRRPWNPVPCRPPLRRCFGITGAEAGIVENGFLIPHPHSSRLNDDQEAEVAANILIQPFF